VTDVATRCTLGQHMSEEALGPLVRKKLFGGYEVPLGPCIFIVSTWLFEKGAVFGRARSDRLNVLVKLLPVTWANPEKEDNICSFLQEVAKKRLEVFGKDPDSFPIFWHKTQFKEYDLSNLDELRMLSMMKVRLGVIMPKLDEWLMCGIGFGATYPDLVQRMWVETHETPNPDEWARARKAGLDIPEEQTLQRLDDIEQHVLLEVGRYVYEYFPQLIEPLSLRIT